tara:strand:- start:471 stop:737 length:267 start_codon:yes stop_codon:yes gene_type:complete
MKVGDLVTLSAAGSGQEQNMIANYATFGMIMKIKDEGCYSKCFKTTYNCKKPLIEVKWFFSPKKRFSDRKQHHWRYEIKKLKKNKKNT